jgi:GNAT superfamily N-acetyltransferase
VRVSYQLDPAPTPALHAEVLACWVDVTNAGGAVGFVAPVTPAEVEPTALHTFDRLFPAGEDRLLVMRTGDRLAGWLVFESRHHILSTHWRTLKRVQVHPSLQRRGLGAALMREAARVARAELGLESLHLTVRGGTGMDAFYRSLGYVEVGRMPRALRVSPDDHREEISMQLDLRESTP